MIIIGKYRIRRLDTMNLVIEELIPEREVREKMVAAHYTIIGYYGKIDWMLENLLTLEVDINAMTELKEILKRWEEINIEICDAVKGVDL